MTKRGRRTAIAEAIREPLANTEPDDLREIARIYANAAEVSRSLNRKCYDPWSGKMVDASPATMARVTGASIMDKRSMARHLLAYTKESTIR